MCTNLICASNQHFAITHLRVLHAVTPSGLYWCLLMAHPWVEGHPTTPPLPCSPRLLHNAVSAQATGDARTVTLATLTTSHAPS